MSPQNQARVWTWIAERFESANRKAQYPVGRLRSDDWHFSGGICGVIAALDSVSSITFNDKVALVKSLAAKRPNGPVRLGGYYWPLTPEGDVARAKVCHRLAREALSLGSGR